MTNWHPTKITRYTVFPKLVKNYLNNIPSIDNTITFDHKAYFICLESLMFAAIDVRGLMMFETSASPANFFRYSIYEHNNSKYRIYSNSNHGYY